MAEVEGNAAAVLVISNIAWDFVWQRHQTMALLFAQEREVIFCEIPGIRRIGWGDAGRILRRLFSLGRRADPAGQPPRVRLLRPLVLPATNRLFCAFNRRQMRRLVARDAALRTGVELVVNYSPSRTARDLIDRLAPRRLVYDCTDDWLAVEGIPAFLPQDEAWILRRADLTLVTGHVLHRRKGPHAHRCRVLPHGALVERFRLPPKSRPTDGGLTLLYYGHLHRQHLDFDLLNGIARARPQWRLVLVGPIKTPHPFPPNVVLPGQQPHKKLREFIAGADVLLLPYGLNDYTRAVLPAKTYECLATGRPVVASRLPELLEACDETLRFAGDLSSWLVAIAGAAESDTADTRERRVALAAANSWESRFAQLGRELAALEAEPASTVPILSIVIVAYGSRDELPACLGSLPTQLLGRAVEVCVVNNSPGDGVAAWMAEAFPAMRCLEPATNLGFGRANNLGCRQTSGECVLFLNPDTIANPEALEHCVRRLRAEPAIGLISPRLLRADGTMDLACRRSIPTAWDGFCRATGLAAAFPSWRMFSGYNLTHLPADGTYDVGAINGAFMLARREVLARVGLFDEAFFMYGDDLDLCIRMRAAGYRIVYEGRMRLTHLKGLSVGRDFERMSRAIFDANRDVYLKHFGRSALARAKWRAFFSLWKALARFRASRRAHRAVRPL